MCTGGGKTACFSEVAKHWKGRVLVLCHRTELVQQAKARLEADLGTRVGVDQGEFRSTFERVVVASVQTVYRKVRLERLRRFSAPTLIIADEAHHAPAKSWRQVLDAFPAAKMLGVTATPDRGDGRAMGLVFDSVAFEYDLADAVADGWLVPMKGEEIILGDVDLDTVGVNAGDLAAGQLDEAVLQGAEGVVQGLLGTAKGKRGLVFCPGVKTAHFVADRLNALHPGIAAAVDGKTDPEVRARTVEDFRQGRLQWLCNCQVFTEGTDLPMAEVVAIARPTKSRALYAQMVGRAGRCLPGVVDGLETVEERRAAIAASAKPHAIVLDFVGNNSKHALASPEDILGGKYDEEDRKVAKKAREDKELGDAATVTDYLELGRQKVRAIAAAMRSKVQMERRSFDPLAHLGVNRENEERRLALGQPRATPKQQEALKNIGFPKADVENLTKGAAGRLLDKHKQRRSQGLATIKQMNVLRRYAAVDGNVSKERATKAIDYIASTGWGRDTLPERVQSIALGDAT